MHDIVLYALYTRGSVLLPSMATLRGVRGRTRPAEAGAAPLGRLGDALVCRDHRLRSSAERIRSC